MPVRKQVEKPNYHDSHNPTCEHDIALCKHCDVVFCRSCPMQWQKPTYCTLPHYPTYRPLPSTYNPWWYSNGLVGGATGSTSGALTNGTTTTAVLNHVHEGGS